MIGLNYRAIPKGRKQTKARPGGIRGGRAHLEARGHEVRAEAALRLVLGLGAARDAQRLWGEAARGGGAGSGDQREHWGKVTRTSEETGGGE